MKYRIWNVTTERWVRNDDSRVCEFDNIEEASLAKERVDDLKLVNPRHRDDVIVVKAFPDETD